MTMAIGKCDDMASSTPCSTQSQLQTSNKQLRKAVAQLSERQELLEEFIELEPEIAAEFNLFMLNRDRMMYAIGYTLEDILMQYGKRSPKSLELVRLMRVVKKHQPPLSKRKDIDIRGQTLVSPPELKHLKITVSKNTGKIHRKTTQRCKKCLDPSHGRKVCPYKSVILKENPEVNALIQERTEKLKETELNNPFLANKYKIKKFGYKVMRAARDLRWRRLEEEHSAIMKGMEASSGQACSTSSAARIWNEMKKKAEYSGSGDKSMTDEEEDDDNEEGGEPEDME